MLGAKRANLAALQGERNNWRARAQGAMTGRLWARELLSHESGGRVNRDG